MIGSRPQHIAILGAGPIGLDCALNAVRQGYRVTVLESGATIAASIRHWEDVELFSPNELNVSEAGTAVLNEMGVTPPPLEQYFTGGEFIAGYLQPIATYLASTSYCNICTGKRVVSVGRTGVSKGRYIGTAPERRSAKFHILINDETTNEESMMCDFDAVIDSSGSYSNPNWLGQDGIPAIGERALRSSGDILYYIPTYGRVMQSSRRDNQFIFSTLTPVVTAVVGAGASAITSIKKLHEFARDHGHLSEIIWITKKQAGELPYHQVPGDSLPQRDKLYALGNALSCTYDRDKVSCSLLATDLKVAKEIEVERLKFCYIANSDIYQIEKIPSAGELSMRFRIILNKRVASTAERCSIEVHNIIGNTGYRPDLDITSELQVHYCYATSGPMKLAASLLSTGGAGGDCLKQVAAGKGTLVNPEPRFYIIGMKSYGRGSAFLMRIGYEQVKNVIELLNEEFPLSV